MPLTKNTHSSSSKAMANPSNGAQAVSLIAPDQTKHTDDMTSSPIPKASAQSSVAAKIGPWGGEKGSPFDSEAPPQRLASVTIHSGHVIDSIAFSYVGQDGKTRTAGPFGGEGGPEIDTIELGPSETLQEVRGTHNIDPFEGHSKLITSLTFVTNLKTYGPFGMAEDKHFSVPVHAGSGAIVGFFGSAERYLVSLGVYVRPADDSVPN